MLGRLWERQVKPGVCPQGALGPVWEEMNKNTSWYNFRSFMVCFIISVEIKYDTNEINFA